MSKRDGRSNLEIKPVRDPVTGRYLPGVVASLEERFWPKVNKSASGGCWLWTAQLSKEGYGIISKTSGHPVPAHRVSYEMACGPIPEGLHIDHLCRVRACVNPAHLEAVTQGENNRRAGAATVPRTHCPQGHPYSGKNLIVRKDRISGVCRICQNLANVRYRKRKKKCILSMMK